MDIRPKIKDIDDRKPEGGRTRPTDEPLDEGAGKSFRDTQPEGFKDNARHSIDAAATDPDVDDTKGGE
ncbi:MAG: hypothetical protein M0D55_07785 [Elusimicrobiota bacterium]|nr:MAG: hypothetical protein M0D55_07785 [Elusimicrobiota bacterium]